MSKRTSKSPGSNTILSYFQKSPPSKNNASLESNAGSGSKKKNNDGDASSKKFKPDDADSQYKLGDIVWAKLDGYPWWPSLVCNPPSENNHVKDDKLHVQFYDTPPSRAWVRNKFIKIYKGSTVKEACIGGVYYSSDKKWRRATEDADAALKWIVEERMKQVVTSYAPDDSNALEDDEDMEADDSKENHPADDSQSKSPKTKHVDQIDSKRRKRIIIESGAEDSEDEFKPQENEEETTDDEPNTSECDNPVKPKKKKRKVNGSTPQNSTPKMKLNNSLGSHVLSAIKNSPILSKETRLKLASFCANEGSPTVNRMEEKEDKAFVHLTFEWLKNEKRRDMHNRPVYDPDHDPRTLFIPDSFMKTVTPAHKQWWEMKAKHLDTVLFFKVGKFYELFHMDAVIGVNELGLMYMKGDYAHSGFPETAYCRFADTLIQKGYKVARVEQTETPQMMEERCKTLMRNPTKYDKVVKREICRIMSKGTRTPSFIDAEITEPQNNYLLAIAEKITGDPIAGEGEYGVCFIDTSIGKFHIGQFSDDRHSSRLRTLVAHYTPVEILFERMKLSSKTLQVFNTTLINVIKTPLISGTEFWDSSTTLKFLIDGDYFVDENSKELGVQWPEALRAMSDTSDSLGFNAREEYDLAVRALGACTWYLKQCCLEYELLSLRNMEYYIPLDSSHRAVPSVNKNSFATGQHMILDGVTLNNLDIIENPLTGTLEGTLLEQMDRCSSPFGKRLFRQWLCAPLCNPGAIQARLDAVEDLISVIDMPEIIDLMKKLPDLERLLSKIHTLGSSRRNTNHPDSRAIFYEEVIYSKKKIADFLAALDGFKIGLKIVQRFESNVKTFCSQLLKQCVTLTSDADEPGKFPDVKDTLTFFENAFNHDKAKKDGIIIPSRGTDPEYDEAIIQIKETEKELEEYLESQRKVLRCKGAEVHNISYWGNARSRYQLEVPDSIKDIPYEYELKSQRKNFKRYWTKDIERMLTKLINAEDQRDNALKDTMRRIFASFDKRYKDWETATHCLALLDVLLSLAQYSKESNGPMCRPEIILPEAGGKPFIEIRNGRHPCISQTFSGGDFIPNDAVVGSANEATGDTSLSSVVLVTGPNMGGKSTLMRQVGLITIIAQLGCYVPAERCQLSPVDRVFTRLGASDRIMTGESTFYVELSETSCLLQHATPHSLVLIDELGRGTATYDGTAIACAVLRELSQRIGCRTFFSTHYHSLVEEFSNDCNIRLGHMACMVENENEDPSQETITFLYKFIPGACPKSYGFNAARLASIPDDIVRSAHTKSKEFSAAAYHQHLFKACWKSTSNVRQLYQQITAL